MAGTNRLVKGMRALADFTVQEALSCVFPVVIFAALALTKVVDLPGLPRYDWLLLICLAAQAGMLLFKLETKDELLVICCFHVIGIALELFKVHMGSWAYPEEAYSKLFGVPLYAGFMYASVASYICQAWRRLDVRIIGWPNSWVATLLCMAVYANFYTHHYTYDYRWVLTAAIVVVFIRTVVVFRADGTDYRMPMTAAYVLVAFFIWLGENIGTLLGAWQYPNQRVSWQIVHWGKLSSWFLLIIISMIIVAELKRFKSRLEGA